MTTLEVELSSLRAWADQVERNGAATAAMGEDAASVIADGDFGRILELITGEYDAMLPAFHAVLHEDGERLDRTAAALRDVARDFAETDRRVAQEFGVGAAITHATTHRGAGGGFEDVRSTMLSCPYVSGSQLPVLTFGFPWDQACDLASWVGLGDPRDEITEFIVGDIAKAETHAAHWEQYATATDAVSANLAHGRAEIARTWYGRAATRSSGRIDEWVSSLQTQSTAMTDMAAHVRDMVQQALDMAQVVVDTLKFFVSTISAGWSYAAIPGYGQWKLVKTLKEAWHLVNNARKVISVFWSFLVVMKDVIVSMVHVFTTTDLPDAPAAPA